MKTGFSPRVDTALALAARAHRNQLRKGTDIPYIIHPVQVAMALQRHGFDEDLVIAGLLHDTLEDTDLGADEIERSFGAAVLALVTAVTEVKVDGGAKRPWRTRKQEQLAQLGGADARVAALKAGDSLHNLHSTLADLQTIGPAIWQRFNASAEDWLWYHRSIAGLVRTRLGPHALVDELDAVIAEIALFSA